MPFLPPNQQRQSTEGISTEDIKNHFELNRETFERTTEAAPD